MAKLKNNFPDKYTKLIKMVENRYVNYSDCRKEVLIALVIAIVEKQIDYKIDVIKVDAGFPLLQEAQIIAVEFKNGQ